MSRPYMPSAITRKTIPWFKCDPTKLLGALGALSTDDGYIYTIIILRIYESNGPISDDAEALARRTGMTRKRAQAALASLASKNKISISPSGAIDCAKTHEFLEEREKLILVAKKAGAESGKKRAKKYKQNQITEATPVEQNGTVVGLPLNDKHLHTDSEDSQFSNENCSTRALAARVQKSKSKMDDDFERFRSVYPRRAGSDPPKDARKKFEAAVKSGAQPDMLIASAEAYARYMAGSDPKYIKQSQYWLSGECWKEDWAQKPGSEDLLNRNNGGGNGFDRQNGGGRSGEEGLSFAALAVRRAREASQNRQ